MVPLAKGRRFKSKASCAGLTRASIVPQVMIVAYYYVYILASKKNGTLYIGLTGDLLRRVLEHRDHVVPGFTKKYGVTRLIWFETHASLLAARQREKQIKAWKRQWKIDLFKDSNPNWDDLYPSLVT